MSAREPHKWVVAGTVMIGTIMAVLDSSVVNVSLPQMRGTLSATVEEITWVVTSYILFVALSTAALATMPRPKITAASGLYNVVRQVFGSVGIAISATQLTSGQTRFRALLSEHVTPFDPATRQWLDKVTGAMTSSGADPGTASKRALALLSANVDGQAAVLAYNRVFILVAILFFISVPLVLLLRGAPEAVRAGGSIE